MLVGKFSARTLLWPVIGFILGIRMPESGSITINLSPIPTFCLRKRSAAHAPMEQQPSEVTFRRRLGRDRGENFSLPYGVADCAAPPVSKRRLRSGPNLHPGDTHHCADGLFARDKHLVHDCANARSLVLFLARPRAGAAGVETCMEQTTTPRGRLALTPLVRPAPGRGGSVGLGAEGA